MSFNKRLIYYFFGFSIGCCILYFILNQKNTEFNYLPNKRVINDLGKKQWVFDDSFIGHDTINLLNNAKVIFSKSKINTDSCNTYKLKKKSDLDAFTFSGMNCDEKVYFMNLIISPL